MPASTNDLTTTGSAPHPLAKHRARRWPLVLLIAASIPVALYAFIFQTGATGDPAFQARFATMPVFAAFHVVGAGIALLIGGFQFSDSLRKRALNVHRWLGRIYLLAVLIAAIGALILARVAHGGPVSQIGFSMLGLVWLYSGGQAYAAVRRGDIVTHRVWMMRNFALSFAAVTLRIYLGALQGFFGLSFDEAYPVVAWLCWVPNLLIVEWFLNKPATHLRGQAG